ncbi:MAG: ATP-binding protein [Nitrospiraceae bacterium]|nr:ATP-binding protein [Nitrospiraceae bacterium]
MNPEEKKITGPHPEEDKEIYFPLNGGDFSDAGAGSKRLREELAALGVPAQVIRRAAICAFEAEINVIIHAVAGSLHYMINEDILTITITDMGPGIKDVALAMKEGYTTAPDWARTYGWGSGMGLPNIKRNADDLVIDSVPGEGTTLKIFIDLKADK